MFWNLVRYEFKNVNKWYLASTVLCLQFQFCLELLLAVLARVTILTILLISSSFSTSLWRTQRHSFDCNNLFNHPKIQG